MKKFFVCISLVLTGLMTSCVDKFQEVDADSKPSWLGESIYAELKNANQERLTGTFSNYVRLIDDLGYAETLNRTGSKTIFPANDEAFARFFQKNEWGVTSYEQLTTSQKKLLLYSSMLDNALLIDMLSTASNGTAEPEHGAAVKHITNVSVIDTIQYMKSAEDMPKGNKYWQRFYEKGIHTVSDNTRPMMVHLTREYMLDNDITVAGNESDFAILTGTPYQEGTAYVFNNRVIKGDVTCQNGYIHQMEDVLVPPGNMAQVLRKHDNTKYFSRIIDHYSKPIYDESTTRQYNDWAKSQQDIGIAVPSIDSIFQVRYLSARSQDGKAYETEIGDNHGILNFDPGWNQYYPSSTAQNKVDNTITDLAAFFVPDDDAVKRFFLPGGSGSPLIEIYGSKRELGNAVINDEAHLMENLDSVQQNNPRLLTQFVKNLLKDRFTATVPSKFDNITNDASENMGINTNILSRKTDGKYDITFANNGVIYVINDMIVPALYNSVAAPATIYDDMQVFGWAIQDWASQGKTDPLGLDFNYYLLAMSANYAFFIPEDNAFGYYYLDPASLAKVDGAGDPRPEVLHFFYADGDLKCTRYYFNPTTGEVYSPQAETIANVKTQFTDILNYHTVVLKGGERLGDNHYYKTKHGGEIYVDGNKVGSHVMSGAQIENPTIFPAPEIKTVYNEKNGSAYRMNRLIQAPQESVYKVLKDNPGKFSKFLDVCQGFEATEVLDWAGISKEENKVTKKTEQDAFAILTNQITYNATTTDGEPVYVTEQAAVDKNIRMFNTYNYTLFAPDNNAMDIAYSRGLPKWEDINDMYEAYIAKVTADPDYEATDADKADMAKAKKMMTQLRDFVRYHFFTTSVYADKTIEGGRYQSLSSDATGIAKEATISGSNDRLTVTDLSNHSVTIDATNSSKMVNKMARDYWLGKRNASGNIIPADAKNATAIYTSSFCAIHQISEPLYNSKSGRFDQ